MKSSIITHLAAAVGLPLLVLWGDSVETVWRPQGKKMTILKNAKGLQGIPVSRVLDELTRLLQAAFDPAAQGGNW